MPGGVLLKGKLDQAGVASVVYESKLTSGDRLALSAQANVLNLNSAVKLGFALELAS